MDAIDKTITALETYHELDSAAGKALDMLDKKLEGTSPDDIAQCRVEALQLLRHLVAAQRATNLALMEQVLSIDDQIQALMTRHGISTD